jgi:hypothetical protein
VWIGGKNFPRETLDYLTYQGVIRGSAPTTGSTTCRAASMEIAPPAGRGAALVLERARAAAA